MGHAAQRSPIVRVPRLRLGVAGSSATHEPGAPSLLVNAGQAAVPDTLVPVTFTAHGSETRRQRSQCAAQSAGRSYTNATAAPGPRSPRG